MNALRLLVGDDDRSARSLLSACARDAFGEIAVLEAENGAEAIQVGLQQRPAIALLDVNMPRLGGIEAAITLRALRPGMRLALLTGEPLMHRERALEHQLPLFGKLELGRTLSWVRTQVEWYGGAQPAADTAHKLELRCAGCGYGVLRSTPPRRCPMCQVENAWIHAASEARLTMSIS